nr:immunoglobulin light chain junction region [Macaca mulatta]MOW58279.1 immunoglobulin light chain junction region [Macaca mulatta]
DYYCQVWDRTTKYVF